ncbi:MAG: hypothetical protein WDN75_01770 [Bacteroidota bacterium]
MARARPWPSSARGRKSEERSTHFWWRRENYLGFGFFSEDIAITDFESAKNYIHISKDNRVVQNLVNSYLMNPRGTEISRFSPSFCRQINLANSY